VKLSSKRRWFAGAAILLLLFFFRPGASRLKSRIITSISAGVGRPVDIGSVHVRLLPRPGFDLENLVVYDDPAFGAEPMLRAGQVTAWLRLTSLARGRLEVARLDLTEPSLNLVHGENGRWNLEALLERTAHIPLAPTAKAKSEPRPGFPYIEATAARINLKSGPEKKPYALTSADLSLWQDSENAWGIRLQAQPMRTDLGLNDTGVLRVNGNWHRAAAFRDTPMDFTVEWSRAQLGQLTKFLTGRDQGWRGEVQLDARLAGTPAKLQVATDASIRDFRRYDITSGQPLRLAAHCDGQYGSLDHTFQEVACNAPVGGGLITISGHMGLPGSHDYELALVAENVPAAALAAMAARIKKNLPIDLTAEGTVRGSVSIHESTTSRLRVGGKGNISEFRLASATSRSEIEPETVPFLLASGEDGEDRAKRQGTRKGATTLRLPAGPHLEFGPFSLAAGRGEKLKAEGWTDLSGYFVLITGDAGVGNTLRLASLFGIPAPQAAADGTTEVNLRVTGSWPAWSKGSASGFLGPQIGGMAKLHNVRAGIRGTGAPVEIVTANLELLPDRVRVEKLSARAVGTQWNGTVEIPRGCGTPGACQIRFDLNADQIALNDLSEWISPRPKEKPWYRVLQSGPQAGPPFLASLHASGRVTAEHLHVQHVTATHVSADVTMEGGKLEVSDLNADILGAKHHGAWKADFNVRPPACSGAGRLSGIPLARLAETQQDTWISGLATVGYQVKGSCLDEFWPSAEGALQFDLTDGTLPYIALAEDEGGLKISSLSGQARLHAGEIEMRDAKLDSPSGKFHLSGTASFKRELDLKLTRSTSSGTAGGYAITGTLAEPHVAPLPGTEQARLKPGAAR